MSHRRKCGCVIADNKDSSVRGGFEMGGYIKGFCEEHARVEMEAVPPLEIGPNKLYRALLDNMVVAVDSASGPDETVAYKVANVDGEIVVTPITREEMYKDPDEQP